MSDETDESLVKDNPLESWEDGSAFGVAKDNDPVCKIPVEEWIKKVEITSTADVPIPEKLVDQVIDKKLARTYFVRNGWIPSWGFKNGKTCLTSPKKDQLLIFLLDKFYSFNKTLIR